jgi:hypothetical protein
VRPFSYHHFLVLVFLLTRASQSGVNCEVKSGMAGEYETNQYYSKLTSEDDNTDAVNVILDACILGLLRNNESVVSGVTIEDVKFVTYGILWPAVCALGIIGNVLNLIVLNQPNMKGTAFIYMRGSSAFCNLEKLITKMHFSRNWKRNGKEQGFNR